MKESLLCDDVYAYAYADADAERLFDVEWEGMVGMVRGWQVRGTLSSPPLRTARPSLSIHCCTGNQAANGLPPATPRRLRAPSVPRPPDPVRVSARVVSQEPQVVD